jgi:hypothetical protein
VSCQRDILGAQRAERKINTVRETKSGLVYKP